MFNGFQTPPFCCIVACASAASCVGIKGNIASVAYGVGAISVTSVIIKVLQELQWNISPNIDRFPELLSAKLQNQKPDLLDHLVSINNG